MAFVRIALLTIRLVMRTKVALFFTFFFPLVFLFVYAGLFAHGNPQAVLYMFGPVVTLNIMGSGFWGLGLQSVMQRERGSLRRYRLAPIGPGTIVCSNLLANYLLGLPTVGLLVLFAHLVFHMPLKISLLTLLILVTVGTFAFSGFGLTIASIANTMQEAQVYNNLAWLTLLFLSGTSVPLPLLPHWVQRVATFLPATYLVSAFQAVMVQGQSLARHWPELLALCVSGTFGLLFAWKLFRWEKEERIPPRRKAMSLAFVFPFVLVGLWMNTFANPMASWATTYSLMGRGTGGSDSASQAPAGNPIENFEDPRASEDLTKRWKVTVIADAGSEALAELSLISPGAAGTEHALRFMGRLPPSLGTPASASARYEFVPGAPKDFHGIQLWIRGDAHAAAIHLAPPKAAPEFHSELKLIPSDGWQPVRLPAGRVGQGLTGDDSWTLEVVVSGPPGEFFFELDELRRF
jgi:ABC-type multidrug transport system permease subunit